MIIILEGNECNYKTTVANKLNKKLNFPILKGSTFESAQSGNEELYKHHFKFTHLDNIILDRGIYSNLVYASLYKDYSILNKEQVKYIENAMTDKAIVVYLHADTDVLIERIRQRGDEYVKEDMLDSINKKYDQVISESNLVIISYNTESFNSDEIVEDVVEFIDEKPWLDDEI